HGMGGDYVSRASPDVPATFRRLTPGGYEITVTADGVAPFRKHVDLRPDDTEVIIASFGDSNSASLLLHVSPEGATVWLDGVELAADAPIPLRVGRHELRVGKEGFTEEKRLLDASAGAQLEQRIQLSPLRGVVEVTSEPSSADVWIDGQQRGQTPAVVEGLELGVVHKLAVKRAGYTGQSRSITLTSDAPRTRVLMLLVEAKLNRLKEEDSAERSRPAARAEQGTLVDPETVADPR